MKIRNLIYLFVICLLAFAMAAPASAMYYESGGTKLWLVPNSGSSVDLNPSGPIHLQDIKGYPFGLFYGTELMTGLGIFVDVAPITGEAVDDTGLIRETSIFRAADTPGSNIRITWNYALELTDKRADIWAYSGEGAEYSTTAAWGKVHEGGLNATEAQLDNVQVGDGKNSYYRVVPSGTAQGGIFNLAMNARTVGKVDVEVYGPASGNSFKYNYVSVPLIQHSDILLDVFGIQLVPRADQGSASEIWGWGGTSFARQAYLKTTGWIKVNTPNTPADFAHEYGAGYFIKTKTGQPDISMTLVGIVNTGIFEYTGSVPVRANLYSSLADPYPISIPLGALGLNDVLKSGAVSGSADQIWGWTGNSFGAQSFLMSNLTWAIVTGATQKVDYFEPGKAYLLKRIDSTTGAVIWKFIPQL